jgi:hypothetical protein
VNVRVYAIAKDEAAHVERFMASCAGADGVHVLDTGSDDGTADLLRRHGATVVVERIDPWRFDVARNRSLELVPHGTDICVCIDLDEELAAGWRDEVERACSDGATRLRYLYAWSDGLTFWYDAIHARDGYRWRMPAHEVLVREPGHDESLAWHGGVLVTHHPDPGKPREPLALLELAVREEPGDARAWHYLTREYLFTGRWRDCIRAARRYLSLPGATWAEERSYTCRLAAKASARLQRPIAELGWLERGCRECPSSREAWHDVAEALLRRGAYAEAHAAAQRALTCDERSWLHFDDPSVWGPRLDLLAHAAASAAANGARDTQAEQAPPSVDGQPGADAPPHDLADTAKWAFRAGMFGRGAQAAEALRSRSGVSPAIRDAAHASSQLYARPLGALVPATEIVPLTFDVDPDRTLFNPTIARDGDAYRALVRSSNYTLSNGVYDLHGASHIANANYLVELGPRLDVRSATLIADVTSAPERVPSFWLGWEDCRLFTHEDQWWASATTREHDSRNLCRIALLRLDGASFTQVKLLDDPDPGRHAKNWMPFVADGDLFFVYSCSPTVVLRCDSQTGRLEEAARSPGPGTAHGLKGGSQGVEVDGGRLFVVHESLDGRLGRVYTHRFVLLDDGLRLTRVSPPFFFLHRGVEFCAGLAVRDGAATVSFGFQDGEAYLATAPLAAVLDLLVPVDSAVVSG